LNLILWQNFERFLGLWYSFATPMEGGVPKSVGARHYSKLLRQADGPYRRYADYLNKLRRSM